MIERIILLALIAIVVESCKEFNQVYNDAKSIVEERREHEKRLQEKGYLLSANDLGFERSRFGSICGGKNYYLSEDGKTGDYLNTAARLLADRDLGSNFSSYSHCLNQPNPQIKVQPKYQSLNGYGNNIQNPTWGMPNTAFARLAPKNYDDGISSIRKTVAGGELPNARKIVLEILVKAEKKPISESNQFNMYTLLDALYISHDQAQTVPIEAVDNCKEIRCCSSVNKKVLDPSVSHSACLPISIDKEDEFYSDAGVGCLNMVRSESATSPTKAIIGEVRNKVTSYFDHSMIYGSDEKENKKVRTFKGGKLNLGPNNLLPVDSNGKYTSISARSIAVPTTAVAPILYARNHNHLAQRLAEINPKWKDEKLFLEARRLNIALLHRIHHHDSFKQIFGVPLDGTYDPNADPSTTNEFNSAVYRFFHFLVNPDMYFVDTDYNVQKILLSDTFGRIDLIERNFDDFLRGTLAAEMNFGFPLEEMYNLFAKNEDGIGLDVLSIDIQRCRDHGLATYLDTRKAFGLKADYKTFEDLQDLFPQSYVKLLKNVYQDVRDIDLYVGGALESFLTPGDIFVGETFGKIAQLHFSNNIASDAYYYTNKNSPNPFTDAQIEAIETFGFSNLLCVNSGLKEINSNWRKLLDPNNPRTPCSEFKAIDLSAWKGI